MSGVVSVYSATFGGKTFAISFDYRYRKFSGRLIFRGYSYDGQTGGLVLDGPFDFQGSFQMSENGSISMTFEQSLLPELKGHSVEGWHLPGILLFLTPNPDIEPLRLGATAFVNTEFCESINSFLSDDLPEYSHRWLDISRAGLTGPSAFYGQATLEDEPLVYFGSVLRNHIAQYLRTEEIDFYQTELYYDVYDYNFRLTVSREDPINSNLQDSNRIMSMVCSTGGTFGLQTTRENIEAAGDNGQLLLDIPNNEWEQATGSMSTIGFNRYSQPMFDMLVGNPPTRKLFFSKFDEVFIERSRATGIYYRFGSEPSLEFGPVVFQAEAEKHFASNSGFALTAVAAADSQCSSPDNFLNNEVFFTMNIEAGTDSGEFSGTVEWSGSDFAQYGTDQFYGHVQSVPFFDQISFSSEDYFGADEMAIIAAGRHNDGSGFIIYMGTTLCGEREVLF